MQRIGRTLAAGALPLALAACGGNSAAPAPTARATPRAVVVVPTPTSAPAPAPTVAATAAPTAAATATAAPTAAPSATAQPLTTPTASGRPALTYASLEPDPIAPGGGLTASVSTTGPVTRVELYLVSEALTSGAPQSFPLSRTAGGGWRASLIAPRQPGVYHFTVGIYAGSIRLPVYDYDAWTLHVSGGGASTSPTAAAGSTAPAAAQALPNNIPLVPPFSYSDPQPVVFSAEGQSVTGSEVSSNARPDIAASAVAGFYETHLPRAGWTVDGGSVPGTGATSFTISATSGRQVVVVQYGGASVHIFYGTLSG